MPPGSFSYDPPPAPLASFAVPIYVLRYDTQQPDGERYSILPNVQCWEIQLRDGNDPPTARLGYLLDDRSPDPAFPSQFDELWPLAIPNQDHLKPYIVLPGDRLVVAAAMPDGTVKLLFDGFSRMPQTNVTPDTQAVSFTAVSVAQRCWDVPINGRVQRDGDNSSATREDGSADVRTSMPTRFNPADSTHPTGQPNCTPTSTLGDDPARSFPVFLDPTISRQENKPTVWTLSGAVRYLLSVLNPEEDPNDPTYEQFIKNPDFTGLDALLDNRRPKDPDDIGFFNPSFAVEYLSNPIVIRDFDCTNMAWPDAVERLLGYHGFGMRWVLTQDLSDQPVNTFEVYRKDAANAEAPRPLQLPQRGKKLDPAQANMGTLSASFDYHGLANEFVIESHVNRYEVSVLLAPLFRPDEADAVMPARKAYLKANIANADGATGQLLKRKYRWYGVDELGTQYWDLKKKVRVTDKPFDFSAAFPPKDGEDGQPSTPTYVIRYRPGLHELLAETGTEGNHYKAQLALSRNYTGPAPPCFWDGSGDWQPIADDWKLLEDRLGIEITADNPDEIHCGHYTKANVQNPGPALHGIRSIARPNTDPGWPGNKTTSLFYLRLTTVIESDQTIDAAARRRDASPLKHVVQRRIDAKDHWRKDTIHISSAFHSAEIAARPDVKQDEETGNLLPRDDTERATDHAAQLRAAHESPAMPAAVEIPGLSLAYRIGSRIDRIAGREVSFRTNIGAEQGEAPSFPFVVAISWSFSGDQQITTLQLSDRRLEPSPETVEHRRGR